MKKKKRKQEDRLYSIVSFVSRQSSIPGRINFAGWIASTLLKTVFSRFRGRVGTRTTATTATTTTTIRFRRICKTGWRTIARVRKGFLVVVVVVVFKTIDGGISNRRSVPGAGRPLSAGSNNKKGKKDSVRELEQILFSILNVRSNSARTGRNETPSGIPFTNSPVKKRAPNEFSRLSSGQSLTGHWEQTGSHILSQGQFSCHNILPVVDELSMIFHFYLSPFLLLSKVGFSLVNREKICWKSIGNYHLFLISYGIINNSNIFLFSLFLVFWRIFFRLM